MTENAQAFVAANKRSPVVSGYALEPDPRKPAKGVCYRLANGKSFTLTPAECGTVEPRWKGL